MSSTKDWTIRVRHILDAIAKIQRYVAGLTEETFGADSMVVDAVVRNFQIIGEAVRHIPDDVQQSHPELPWSEMRNMWHLLVHQYDVVDVAIVWTTVRDDLPPLVPLLTHLLDETSP
jgi:uncharacterized protein with HEPN domain